MRGGTEELRLTDLSKKDRNGVFTEHMSRLKIITQITAIAELDEKTSSSQRHAE